VAQTLTVAQLRGTARLYRAGVDGAADELSRILAEHVEELPALLGFPAANLERLREHQDPAQLLAATIEALPRVARDSRSRAQREMARSIAIDLARSARIDEHGTVDLDIGDLQRLVLLWPATGLLAFDARGSVSVGLLRALLQRCARVTAISVLVATHHVVVAYETATSRGCVRLMLASVARHADVLLVPVDTLGNNARAEVALPLASSPRRRGFAWRFVDALAAAVGGGP
jgi:hypothetical protein